MLVRWYIYNVPQESGFEYNINGISVHRHFYLKTIGLRVLAFFMQNNSSVATVSSQGLTFLTPPRIDLLCMKNWGIQWTIEISSNE